ncbi:MAG: hypothetical protein LUD53_03505 [Clostridiales bacterium]|nr:hypothetical protein [Clostridiales bacterium]
MSIAEIISCGGGGVLILLTLIQVMPLKVNPWSAIAKALGRAINAEVLQELEKVKATQQETQKQLSERVQVEDERNADAQREKILHFNVELMRKLPHTREDFIEILAVIDFYEDYCKDHENYKNNRAVYAVKNIKRVYEERLEENDFCKAE